MSPNEKRKAKFRRTNKWLNFRKYLKKKQKVDPVTGSPLNTKCNCHHLDLSIDHYEMIGEDRQIMLNAQTHDVLHYFYGDERRRHDWRKRILIMIRLLKLMDKFNKAN